MAFNINAQIILQAPKNIKSVTNSIQNQLQGVTINVGANIPKNVQSQLNNLNNTLTKTGKSNKGVSTSGLQAVNTLNSMGKSAKHAGGAMHMLGKETALTFKRFAAAGIVTATFFRMTQAIAEAVPKALEFQREMMRLEQITGKTSKELMTVQKAVRGLSTQLGVDANELANLSKIFAQTGQSIREIEASVRAVARSSLAPTFGEMEQTAEGLVAALNQFNIKASQSEAVLGSLNRVSKKFAVESQDLVAAIRRAGGVFAIAAGDTKKPIEALQEFTAVFTAVRSTTRESAETVATGLRTIFTRLQRRGTIDALKSLGINLTDANGKFIGLFESFRTLSRELDSIIQKGDAITLSGITEELGGMRQVGKLIPAIKEFRKAESALLEAQKGAQEGLGADVAKGLTPLIKQFEMVQARFNELIRGISESGTFKAFAKTALGLANAFISIGEAITPILPILTAIAGMKLGKGMVGFASGFFGSFGAGGGMKASGQAMGSLATGSGKASANTATNTQAVGKLSTVLSSNTTALGTNNTNLGTLNTALNTLHGSISPLQTSINNLDISIDSLRTAILKMPIGGVMGGAQGRRRGARPPRGFASGGLVPGTGNRDTIPAMLTPGEFVVRKSAVNAMGTDQLGAINRYNTGGIVRVRDKSVGVFGLTPQTGVESTIPLSGSAVIKNPVAIRALSGNKGPAAAAVGALSQTQAAAFLNASPAEIGKILGDPFSNASTLSAKRGKPISATTFQREVVKEVGRLTGIQFPKSAKATSGFVNKENLQKVQESYSKSLKKLKGFKRGVNRLPVPTGKSGTLDMSHTATMQGNISAFSPGIAEQLKEGNTFGEIVEGSVRQGLKDTIDRVVTTTRPHIQPVGKFTLPDAAIREKAIANLTSKGAAAIESMEGYILEGVIASLTGVPLAGSDVNFDFPMISADYKKKLGNLFDPDNDGGVSSLIKADAKRTISTSLGSTSVKGSIAKKIVNDINKGIVSGVSFSPAKMNKGGIAQGTDTVPALLTPGEYVINRKSAQAFGYGNLKNINRYAAGGIVKKGRTNYGTPGGAMGQAAAKRDPVFAAQKSLAVSTNKLKEGFKELGGSTLNAFFGMTTLQAGLEEISASGEITTMSLMNLGFGISMLAPMVTQLVAVYPLAMAAITDYIATHGTAAAALKAAAGGFIATLKGLSPMMQGAIAAGFGMIGGFVSDAIFNSFIGVQEETIGQSGTIKGRRGVSDTMAATQAGVGGGLEGAGLAGGLALMMGATGGMAIAAASVGALVKGYSDAQKAAEEQRDFTALLKLSESMDNFADKFDLLGTKLVLSNEQMRDMTLATYKLTAELSNQAIEITDFETQTSEGGVRVGSFGVPQALNWLGIGDGTGGGSGAGVESFRAAGASGSNSLIQGQVTGNILGVAGLATPFGAGLAKAAAADEAGILNQNVKGVGDQFAGDITWGERLADGITGVLNAFLPEESEFASSQERRMMAVSEGLSAVGRDSFKEVDLEKVGEQLQLSVGAAGDFFKQRIEEVSTKDLVNLSDNFDEARDQLEKLGVDISGFEQHISAGTSAAVLDKVTKASRSSNQQQQEIAGAYVALSAKAKETGKTVVQLANELSPAEFNEFARSAGLVTGNAQAGAMAVRNMAAEERKRIENEIPEMILMNEKLARAEAIAGAALNDYISSFTRFSKIVESESLRVQNMVGLLEGSIDSLTGPSFETAERFNPFENIDAASFGELEDAIDRIIERTGGGGVGFEGLKEIAAIQKNLPDVLRDVTTQVLSEPKAQTQDEVGNLLNKALKDSLPQGMDIDNVPAQVFESIQSSISGLIGNRQDAAGTTEDELKRLFESEDFEAIMDEFSDATGPVVEALSSLDSAITQLEQAQLAIIQKQTEFAQKEIDARLRQIDIINKTSDALDKFRPGGGPKNTVARAEQRVLDRQKAILGGAGGAKATTDVIAQQKEVERLRAENRTIRQNIANKGGPTIGADITPAAAGSGYDKAAVDAQQQALLQNSQDLQAHEQALQSLISSTDMLDATMAELSDIEKSRMDARQIAQFEAKRMASILQEADPAKRAQMMEEQFAGDRAFNKLQSGQALNAKDIAALIDGGLERRLKVGVASGAITEEQAEERRAQFNRFLSQTGLPGMNQMLGGPFDAAAMNQLQAATALGGTAQGTTQREQKLIADQEQLSQEQAQAVENDMANQSQAFQQVITQAQTSLLSFSTAVQTATKNVNDAQIEMDRKLQEAQELRESAQKDEIEFKDQQGAQFKADADAKREAAREEGTKRDGEGLVDGIVSLDTHQDLASGQFAMEQLQALIDEGSIEKDAAMIAVADASGEELVKRVQFLMEAIGEINKLRPNEDAAGKTEALDKILGFKALEEGADDDLKPLNDMYKEMTTPGSIYVHDIHAEKLLIEIVKLLGGSEQHLQTAAEAAKAEIAGLKSPTSAGVAGNLRSAASDSMIQPPKSDAEKVRDSWEEINKRLKAAGQEQADAASVADSIFHTQRPGDGQFLSGFAAQGFDEMLASGQFGGNLSALSGRMPELDTQAILDDIQQTLMKQSDPEGVDNSLIGVLKAVKQSAMTSPDMRNHLLNDLMSADEVQRASQRFSQPVGSIPVPKLSPEEKKAMDERNKIGIQDPNLLAADKRLGMDFERLRNIEDNNRREEARIAGGKGRSPLDQDIFDLQQKSAGHDMISSMLELMLADLKGEDVSKLTQEDIDRRKFGRLDEATQTKKVVTDALLAAQGGRGEGLAAGRFKQGDIESAVSGIGGTRFGKFLNDQQKLDAEVAIRDKASRMGIVSGRTGDASKSRIQLKALNELDAKTNVITKLPKSIDDSLNVRGKRPTGAAQVFGGFNQARALIQAEEDEKALQERLGKERGLVDEQGNPRSMTREELSKAIAQRKAEQARDRHASERLSPDRIKARMDKIKQIDSKYGHLLDSDNDSPALNRIRKQRENLTSNYDVQAAMKAEERAEAARIAKEEEAKKNATMTPDPSSRTPLEHPMADAKTGLQHAAAAAASSPNIMSEAFMKLPLQLTDEDKSNMVRDLVDSGELTNLRTSFDSLNTDAVPNLVQALSDLNTTLTTGAAGGATTGEEGVNIRTLVDAINSLDQVTVNVAVAPVNVILNTGGLADQLRNIIAVEALKALKGDVMNQAIDDRIRLFNANEPAG